MKPPARVLIVDDHPLLRCGLAEMVGKDPGLLVCGEADSAGTTILAIDDDPPPDLVILDLMLRHEDGLELIKQLRALRPGLLILVISMHNELIYAERALRAGASGFIMKNEPSHEVLAAVHAVLQGGIYLSNRMRVLMSEIGLTSDPFRFLELHVFRLIGAGLSTKQIATVLHLSGKTIETYRENLKIKLSLSNARELLSAAKQWVDKAG